MKVFILTPEKTVYEGEALTLLLPGLCYPFQILENHAFIIAVLTEGNINIQSINHYFSFYIKNGFLKAKNNIVNILIH